MPFLEYRDAQGQPVQVEVGDRDVIVGRHDDCDLRLPLEFVSRRHARIFKRGAHWAIEDLGSSHGTYLNRIRMPAKAPHPLAHGDRIGIGDLVVTFAAVDLPPDVDATESEGDLMRTIIGARKLDLSQLVAHPNLPIARLVRTTPPDSGKSTDPPAAPEQVRKADADVAHHLLAIVRISDELRQQGDIAGVCGTAVRMAMEATGAARGVLAFSDAEDAPFLPRVQLVRDETGAVVEATGIVPSSTFLERVVERRTAQVAVDTGEDSVLAAAQSVVSSGIRSMCAAPLWDGTRLRGWLYLDAVGGAERFRPAVQDLVTAIAHTAAAEIRVQEEQAKRRNLTRFLAADVIKHIESEAKEGRLEPALSAREQEVTILFSDIKGFTSMSERVGAAAIKAFLDEYFDRMTRILVDRHHATLDKYIGDAIMALFGAPFSRGTAEEARHAVEAAIEMRDEIGRMRKERPEWSHLDVRTGINTGKVIAGMLGSPQRRMEYTVIGDAVNVASRLESSGEPGKIQIGEATWLAVKDRFEWEPAGERQVKNREVPVRSFWVLRAR